MKQLTPIVELLVQTSHEMRPDQSLQQLWTDASDLRMQWCALKQKFKQAQPEYQKARVAMNH